MGSAGGFGERWVRVCNGVCNGFGHNVARVGTVWHNLAQRFAVLAGRERTILGGCVDAPADEATDVECRHAIAAALDRVFKLYAPQIDADSGVPVSVARLDAISKRAAVA